MAQGVVTLIVVFLAVPAVLALMYGVDALLVHLSPSYAARRELREQARVQRQQARYRASKESRHKRMLDWAKSHPNNPTARQYLELAKSEPKALRPEPSKNTYNPEEALRKHFEYVDGEAEREAEYKRQAEMDLNWALAHPSQETARRHLTEVAESASKQIAHLDNLIHHVQFRLNMSTGDEVAAIEDATTLEEYEADRRVQADILTRAQNALDSVRN